jgi:Na+/proline symporter
MPELKTSRSIVLSSAAETLMDKGGACIILLLVFMACTSCFSADLVLIAFVFGYDVYDAHIDKHVSGAQVIRISHVTVIVWTVCIATIASGISQTTIGVSYTLTTTGIWNASMVVLMYATVLWRHQNVIAATAARFLGSIISITG